MSFYSCLSESLGQDLDRERSNSTSDERRITGNFTHIKLGLSFDMIEVLRRLGFPLDFQCVVYGIKS